MPFAIIKRAVLEELRRDIRRKEIAFLIGPRQAGKTTIMQIIQGEMEAAGEKTLFLSLDYDYDREYFASQQSLLKKIELELGGGPGFVFIDEIQRREDAGVFLKGLQDMRLPTPLTFGVGPRYVVDITHKRPKNTPFSAL
ncbi:MAG: AAA family ATPase [Pseudomonadota bacterium]